MCSSDCARLVRKADIIGGARIVAGLPVFRANFQHCATTHVVISQSAVSWKLLEDALDPAWSAQRTPRFEPRALS